MIAAEEMYEDQGVCRWSREGVEDEKKTRVTKGGRVRYCQTPDQNCPPRDGLLKGIADWGPTGERNEDDDSRNHNCVPPH